MKKVLLGLTLVLGTLVSNAQLISKHIDKYENKINWMATPSSLIYFQKTMNIGDTTETWDTYYVCFYTRDSYTTFTGRDAIILFEDNTKMEIDGDVSIKYYKPGIHEYSISNFGKELVEKLATTKIKGYKIDVFEQSVPVAQRELIRNAAKKILSSNQSIAKK